MSFVSSLVKGVGKTLKTVAKPAAVLGLTAINPALGAAASLALKGAKAVTAAKSAVAQVRNAFAPSPAPSMPPLPPPVVPLEPVVMSPGAMPVLMPVQGTLPTQAPPPPPADIVPAMPYAQFRAIMQQVYDKGRLREFG